MPAHGAEGVSHAPFLPPPLRSFFRLPIAALALIASTAHADIRAVQVQCWEYNDNSGSGYGSVFARNDWSVLSDYARPALEKTDTSSNDIYSRGHDFDEDTEEQLYCAVNVPPDYDTTSSTKPRLVLMGWSIDDELCNFVPGTRTVILGVSSRAYAGGDSVSQAWSTETNGTINFTCDTGACGGIDCNRSDIVKSVEIDAAVNVSDWNPLEMLLLRIRRKVASDTLNSDFHLVTVMLKYDAAY